MKELNIRTAVSTTAIETAMDMMSKLQYTFYVSTVDLYRAHEIAREIPLPIRVLRRSGFQEDDWMLELRRLKNDGTSVLIDRVWNCETKAPK